MESITKEVIDINTEYSEKPYYIAKVQIQACFCEILINDIPVFSYNVKGGMTNEIPLNSYILKSEIQNLKIRLAPINNQTKLSEQVDFSIDVGYNDIIGQNGLGKFSQSVQFSLKQEIKDKKLPYFEIELPFTAEVPWNYGYILDNAQDLSPLKDKLNPFVKSFYDILDQRNSSKYKELIKNKIRRQSDVKYLTEKEIKGITQELDLSRIKKLSPLNSYDVKLYAHGKLVRFINKTVDEDGNRYLFKFTVPPLMPGGRDGESALNYLFYLPNGKTELEVF